MRVPDLIEPFVAWRVWDVALTDDGLVLESLFHTAHWAPGHRLKATCRYGCPKVPSDAHAHYDGDTLTMPCGIYAGKTLKQAAEYLPDTLRAPNAMLLRRTRTVIGKVALTGLVKEHEKGYRAEYAQPVELYVPISFGFPVECWESHPETAARLLRERYNVPVRLFRRVSELEDA